MRTDRRPFRRFVAGSLVASLLAGGCASNTDRLGERAVGAYFDGDLARARDVLAPLAEKTDENYVLNNLRLGSVALLALDLPGAEAAFFKAVEVMNAGGVNRGAREFSAYAFNEKLKIWKGEPFERAMASYYLGVAYYLRGDYGNARASFENCLFKLADYGESPDDPEHFKIIESDFALAAIMIGRCHVKLGNDGEAQRNFDIARRTRPDLEALCDIELHRRTNVLLLVDADFGPRKVVNDSGQIVGFLPGPEMAGPIALPRVVVDGRERDVGGLNRPTVDTIALAERREWRSIDTARAVKDALGKTLVVGGALATAYGLGDRRGDVALAGLAVMAVGALLAASAKADLRQWEMVPRTVFLLPLELEPGTHEITVIEPASRGGRAPYDQTWVGVVVTPDHETALYMRLLPWQNGPFRWPTREWVRETGPYESEPVPMRPRHHPTR
jgi:tetratricopeptide (TPR) repeat protein